MSQNWMYTVYDGSVKELFPVKKGNIMVKIEDRKGVVDKGVSKKINLQPSLLGSFLLSPSQGIMNDVVVALDGLKNIKKPNGDTDSVYIDYNDKEIFKAKGFIGKDTYQSKNDYGKGGILFGLLLAPKINYCIVIDENGVLSQKTTSKNMIEKWWGSILKTFLIWSKVKMFWRNRN